MARKRYDSEGYRILKTPWGWGRLLPFEQIDLTKVKLTISGYISKANINNKKGG